MVDYTNAPRNDYFCLDARSFYASCEAVKRGFDPNKVFLVVVGDLNYSGSIILAASPKMKEVYNIGTGARLHMVPKLKHIHIVEANMKHYLDVSVSITRLLCEYVPYSSIWQYSVDEMFLKMTGLKRLYGECREAATMIQKVILDNFGIPVTIGIGENPFLSKFTLDNYAKKEGIAECRYEHVPDMVWPVPIESCWGIGEATALKLRSMGIRLMGQLAKAPLHLLRKKFGIIGEQLYWHANGIDYSDLHNIGEPETKGFSHSITLLRDYLGDECKTVIIELAEEVCRRARKAGLAAKTVHLYVGYSRGEPRRAISRTHSLTYYTNLTMDVYRVCLYIFDTYYKGGPVRQIGIFLSNVAPDDALQLDLFQDNEKQRNLAKAMDAIRDKYGSDSLLRASSYTKAGVMLKRSNQIGGHNA